MTPLRARWRGGLLSWTRLSTSARIILLLIITYPINIELVTALRPVDFVIALAFLHALWFGRLRSVFLPVLSILIGLLLLSATWGMLIGGFDVGLTFGVGLIIKYVEFLVLIWVLASSRLESWEVDYLLRFSAVVFLLMVVFVIGRLFLGVTGIIRVQRLRPDFPFTKVKPGQTTAGHLMGMYLATGFVMVAVYRVSARKDLLVTVLIVLMTAASVVLTGSRTPFIAVGVVVLVGLFSLRRRRGRVRRFSIRLMAVFVLALLLAILLLVRTTILDIRQVSELVTRALTFSFATDLSASGRIAKTTTGLANVWKAGVIIGPGPFLFGLWFDNGLIRILHDFGLVGFFYAFVLLCRLAGRAFRFRSPEGRTAFLGLVCFCVGNVATEFFLVARASVPFVVAFALLMRAAQFRETSATSGAAAQPAI